MRDVVQRYFEVYADALSCSLLEVICAASGEAPASRSDLNRLAGTNDVGRALTRIIDLGLAVGLPRDRVASVSLRPMAVLEAADRFPCSRDRLFVRLVAPDARDVLEILCVRPLLRREMLVFVPAAQLTRVLGHLLDLGLVEKVGSKRYRLRRRDHVMQLLDAVDLAAAEHVERSAIALSDGLRARGRAGGDRQSDPGWRRAPSIRSYYHRVELSWPATGFDLVHTRRGRQARLDFDVSIVDRDVDRTEGEIAQQRGLEEGVVRSVSSRADPNELPRR